jgi:ribosomal protein S18 acetylase RimI-like enzyme
MPSRKQTAAEPEPPSGPTLRRATPDVAPQVAPMLLDALPSLEIVLGDRPTALRGAEACYRSERTEFAHRFGLLADSDGDLVGIAIAFPGRLYQSLKLGTGVTLARAAGSRHAAEVVRRERALARLLPRVDPAYLYVSTVTVVPKHRRRGVATTLMSRVLAGAQRMELGVALDTPMDNEAAREFYEGFGFRVVAARETKPSERQLIPVAGMLRLERNATDTPGAS